MKRSTAQVCRRNDIQLNTEAAGGCCSVEAAQKAQCGRVYSTAEELQAHVRLFHAFP